MKKDNKKNKNINKNLSNKKKISINDKFSMIIDNCKLDKIKDLLNNKIFIRILIVLISFSISLLSLYLMIGKVTDILKYITLIVSFIFSYVYLSKNYRDIFKLIRNNKIYSIISLIFSMIIYYEMMGIPLIDEVKYRFFNIEWFYYFIFPSLCLIFTIFFILIKDWFIKFFKKMDSFEKKAYLITSLITLVILMFTYYSTDYFYMQFDRVYSIDSGLVYNGYFPDPHYYGIKHPLTSLINFPMYAIINFIFSSNLKAVILQYINIQLLIFIGLELKRLTNSKWVYVLYMLSFSTMLYSLFFEKYVLIVFLLVTYLYNTYIEKKDGTNLLILTVGMMPTNIFIGITEFFKGRKFNDMSKYLTKLFLTTLLIFVVAGRIHCFPNGMSELAFERGSGTPFFPMDKNINAATKMVTHSFIAIASDKEFYNEGAFFLKFYRYMWNDVEGNISYVGIGIILIILFGIVDIIKNKRKIYYSFLSGFIFSLLLFIVLTWDTKVSPLFSICFSWAIIPLFIFGIERIFNLFKINKNYNKYIYGILIIIMLFINIREIINIYEFANTYDDYRYDYRYEKYIDIHQK